MDKVPATGEEALTSSLVGFFQKRKLRSMLMHVAQHDQDKPSTWDGASYCPFPLLVWECGRARARVCVLCHVSVVVVVCVLVPVRE